MQVYNLQIFQRNDWLFHWIYFLIIIFLCYYTSFHLCGYFHIRYHIIIPEYYVYLVDMKVLYLDRNFGLKYSLWAPSPPLLYTYVHMYNLNIFLKLYRHFQLCFYHFFVSFSILCARAHSLLQNYLGNLFRFFLLWCYLYFFFGGLVAGCG